MLHLAASVALPLASSRMTKPGRRLFAVLGRLPHGLAQADLDAVRPAADAYRAAHGLFERAVRADPGNALWQRDLAVSWSKLGDVRQAQGDLAGALEAYTASKGVADRLAAALPQGALLRWAAAAGEVNTDINTPVTTQVPPPAPPP